MRALYLVPSADSVCFQQQVSAVEDRGVEVTTLAVSDVADGNGSRDPTDYLRVGGRTLRHSLGSYDLVHANYGLVGPLAVAQPRLPVVLTLYGSDLMGDRWLRWVSRSSARFAEAVVLPSLAMADYLSVPYEFVPFGVDTDQFRPIPREEARERVGWDPGGTVVLFPYTRHRPVKNYPRAERVVERADVDADLRWVTGVPHEEMPYYMNAADAVLVTSDRESGPMVVKEAAACNVPVVSTDVGFAGEVLADVENSAVCGSEAELVAALERVLRSSGRSDGRDRMERWSTEQMAERLHEVYRNVLRGEG